MIQADLGPVHLRGRLGDPFPEDDVCSGLERPAGESEEQLFGAPGNPVGPRPGRGARNEGRAGKDAGNWTAGESQAEPGAALVPYPDRPPRSPGALR